MPKYHFCAQYSAEYDTLKLGLPTSSSFDKLFTKPSKKFPQGQPSKQWKGLAKRLIAERSLGDRIETSTTYHMDKGLEMEPEAVAWYEWDQGVETQHIGFITSDDGKIGCSPDRLVGDDGLLEVKCPGAVGHIGYIIPALLIDEVECLNAAYAHWPQLQGQLLVSERKWVDLLVWHRRLQRVVVRVERDEEYIDQLSWQLRELNRFVDGAMDKIGEVIKNAADQAPLAERVRQTLTESLSRG
jgi:hypothetical protein